MSDINMTEEVDELQNAVDAACALIDRLQEKNKRLRAENERLTADGIHTCHDQCPRYACVLRRERDTALADVERLRQALRINMHAYGIAQEATDALEALVAERDRLKAALETIAEGRDSGRHDGLPADVMHYIACEALEGRSTLLTIREWERLGSEKVSTHGTPELDDDARKLAAMGQDPGATFAENPQLRDENTRLRELVEGMEEELKEIGAVSWRTPDEKALDADLLREEAHERRRIEKEYPWKE